MDRRVTPSSSRHVLAWLWLCVVLVVGMVALGGYTRLSGSGLSMTTWNPVHGVVPPLSTADWEEAFARYRAIPQYHYVHPDMTLAGFQAIFWPEYAHRLLGRIIGLVFALPLLWFWLRGVITGRFAIILAGIFALGGLQGLMGWRMVSSGLTDRLYVGHLHLSAHLALALLLLAFLLWQIRAVQERADAARQWTRPAYSLGLWCGLLALQMWYGALTAGLHAGLLYPTYPLMGEYWVPPGLSWRVAEDPTTVQFLHRMGALCLLIGYALWWYGWHPYVIQSGLRRVGLVVGTLLCSQWALGVLTLVNGVPLPMAMLHQLCGTALWGCAVWLLYGLRRAQSQEEGTDHGV